MLVPLALSWRGKDLRCRCGATAVVRLPHQIGLPGRGIDEGARVEHSDARGAAGERTTGAVGEDGRAQRRRRRHRDAAVSGVRGMGVLRRVVEHDPMPAVEEHARRRLGVGGLPGGRVRQRAGARTAGVGLPAGGGVARRQRLDVVPQRGARRKGVVRAVRVQRVRVTGVVGVGRRRGGRDDDMGPCRRLGRASRAGGANRGGDGRGATPTKARSAADGMRQRLRRYTDRCIRDAVRFMTGAYPGDTDVATMSAPQPRCAP